MSDGHKNYDDNSYIRSYSFLNIGNRLQLFQLAHSIVAFQAYLKDRYLWVALVIVFASLIYLKIHIRLTNQIIELPQLGKKTIGKVIRARHFSGMGYPVPFNHLEF